MKKLIILALLFAGCAGTKVVQKHSDNKVTVTPVAVYSKSSNQVLPTIFSVKAHTP